MEAVGTTDSGAGSMKLVGGDPCLDFVNTLGGRVPASGTKKGSRVLADKLSGYRDLLAWSRHASLLGDEETRRLASRARRRPREAAAVLRRALSLREALYRTLLSLMAGQRPAGGDLRRLGAEIAAARDQEVLRAGRGALRWEWMDPGGSLDSPLWPVSRAAAALITSDLGRLRQCGGERCGWLFLDRSRNGSRQWCRMADCGNVSKVRRFRERHARPRPAR
jgi:predicted RNA-binding Zn ribbon-like protein